jgi:hypothetical protein
MSGTSVGGAPHNQIAIPSNYGIILLVKGALRRLFFEISELNGGSDAKRRASSDKCSALLRRVGEKQASRTKPPAKIPLIRRKLCHGFSEAGTAWYNMVQHQKYRGGASLGRAKDPLS